MKGKLIKLYDGSGYRLDDKNGSFVGSTILSAKTKLSLKNCQAIELGYDLSELVEREEPTLDDDDLHEYEIGTNISRRSGFIKGFQTAMEIRGDKQFSLEDMIKCTIEHAKYCQSLTNGIPNFAHWCHNEGKDFIQSLQKIEWDVEIEMEDVFQLKNRRGGLTNMGKPKLDADGCLILKRI